MIYSEAAVSVRRCLLLPPRFSSSLPAENAFAVGRIDAPHSGGEAVAGIKAQSLSFGFVGVAGHDFDFHGYAAFFDFDDEFEWHGCVMGLCLKGITWVRKDRESRED